VDHWLFFCFDIIGNRYCEQCQMVTGFSQKSRNHFFGGGCGFFGIVTVMKSEGFILVAVLGICSLVGVGASQAVAPVLESVNLSAEESTPETFDTLRQDLTAHYKDLDVTDEALLSLACGEEGFLGQKDCYEGPTTDVTKYGTAEVVLGGKTVTVQLTSMPAGAFLLK
jgi:hypothetical protein